MRATVAIPVTVKTRIGIDDQDSYAFLRHFTACMMAAGADHLTVHARKAWLSGLSPKENRDIPPLDYPRVHRLKREFADLPMSINGGFTDLDAAAAQLDHVDGVMIGSEAYRNPYVMAAVDRRFFGAEAQPPTRAQIVADMRDFIGRHLAGGGALKDVTRHMLGLYHGQPGGRSWRRVLSEQGHRSDADLSVLDRALARVEPTHALEDTAA